MKSENTVIFAFAVHQDVTIAALGLPGRIFARCDRGDGAHTYRVIWWANGDRKDEWLYEHELSEAKTKRCPV